MNGAKNKMNISIGIKKFADVYEDDLLEDESNFKYCLNNAEHFEPSGHIFWICLPYNQDYFLRFIEDLKTNNCSEKFIQCCVQAKEKDAAYIVFFKQQSDGKK